MKEIKPLYICISNIYKVIIGRNGKIIYKNDAVNAETDTEEVLGFIKQQKAE